MVTKVKQILKEEYFNQMSLFIYTFHLPAGSLKKIH